MSSLISFHDRCFQTAMLQLHFRNGCYYGIYVDIIVIIYVHYWDFLNDKSPRQMQMS